MSPKPIASSHRALVAPHVDGIEPEVLGHGEHLGLRRKVVTRGKARNRFSIHFSAAHVLGKDGIKGLDHSAAGAFFWSCSAPLVLNPRASWPFGPRAFVTSTMVLPRANVPISASTDSTALKGTRVS